jgi:hypothetical protein
VIADLDEQLRVDLVVGEVRVGRRLLRRRRLPKPSEPRTVLFDGKTQLKR